MELDPLLLGHGFHLCFLIFLLIDKEISGPVLHEEKISLVVTNLPTLIDCDLFLLDYWLFLFWLFSIIVHLITSDLALCEQSFCLLILLKFLLVCLSESFYL